MRAGKLDRKITIQRKAVTQSTSGAEVEQWADRVHRRSASYFPVSGDERFGGDQWASREQVEFTIRYSDNLADLSPLDRVIYPAPTEANTTNSDQGTVFEIMAVHEVDRRKGLRILAARRSEATS